MHVKGIELSDLEVSYLKEDLRPAFVLNDVKGAASYRIQQSGPLPDTRRERIKQRKL